MRLYFEATMRKQIKDAIDGQRGGYPKLDRIVLTHSEWDNLMAEYSADNNMTTPSPGTHLVIISGVHVSRGKS